MKFYIVRAALLVILLFAGGACAGENTHGSILGAWRVEVQGMENPGVTGVGRALFFEPLDAPVSDGKYTGALELRQTLLRGNEVYRSYRAVATVTGEAVEIIMTNIRNGFIWKMKGKFKDGQIRGNSRDQLYRHGWVTFTRIPLEEGGGNTSAVGGSTSPATTAVE